MSQEEHAIQPSGLEVSITDTGEIVVDFRTDQIPLIQFNPDSAEVVGSHLNTAADKARKDGDW